MGYYILKTEETGRGDNCTDAPNSHQIHGTQCNHSELKQNSAVHDTIMGCKKGTRTWDTISYWQYCNYSAQTGGHICQSLCLHISSKKITIKSAMGHKGTSKAFHYDPSWVTTVSTNSIFYHWTEHCSEWHCWCVALLVHGYAAMLSSATQRAYQQQ